MSDSDYEDASDGYSQEEFEDDNLGGDEHAEDMSSDYDDEDEGDHEEDGLDSEMKKKIGKHKEEVDKKEMLKGNLNKLTGQRRPHREEIRKLKNMDKKERRERASELGLPKQVPKTIENQRITNEDLVEPGDEEVMIDESLDEMASYFSKSKEPKILITTTDNPHQKTLRFCRELRNAIPNSEFRFRRKSSLKKLIKVLIEKGYSDLIVINEDWRKPNALMHCHLPNGPTAYYRLSSIRYVREIKNRARYNDYRPEVIINNMTTRLGHTVGRMLASVFHYDPQFKGRKVVTFHNQRDYIFFRHHLYEFKSDSKVNIQELGPRFTLKLRSLQKGTFDSKYGEFEWVLHRHDSGIQRRKFTL